MDILPYRKIKSGDGIENMYAKWLKNRQMDVPEGKIDFLKQDSVPIAGTNWPINAANVRAQLVTDFADGHSYWYGWTWEEDVKKAFNKPMTAEIDSILPRLSFTGTVC